MRGGRRASKKLRISIGDEIRIHVTSTRLSNTMKNEKYTVTGTVVHPDYMSPGGKDYCILPMSSFDTSDSAFDYTNLFIDADVSKKINPLSKAYSKEVNRIRNEVEDVLSGLSEERVSNLEKDLDDEYEKAKNEADDKLQEAKDELDKAQKEFDEKIADAEKELADGEKEIKDGRDKAERELSDGAKEIEDAKKEYESKKKEALDKIAELEQKLKDGREEFESEKEKGEKELADAKKEYADAQSEVAEKLADLKRQINKAKETPCKWFVQTRDANLNFVEFSSYCDILEKLYLVFTPIYAVVVIIVCFFTMTIIVEEQAKETGACKAFGMYKNEIRNKYLLFGASASLIGALIGIVGGFFIEKVIGNSVKTMFVFGMPSHGLKILPLVLLPAGAVVVTGVAVFWASKKILSCSAVGLISGNEPKKKSLNKAAKKNGGSVYTRLLFNNFVTDLGRETVSVVVILVCCVLIGLGTTVKLAHSGAMNNQVNNIFLYDISLTMSDTIEDQEKEAITDAISGYNYISLGRFGAVIQSETDQSITDVSDASRSNYLFTEKAGMIRLYTVVVFIVIGFSIMLSFMILLNLSNILVEHRMRELLTMRVNGFSNGQVIGYLVRELVVTTSLGLLLGLIIGIPVTSLMLRTMEANAFMFLRKVYVGAWALSVACNVLFAVITTLMWILCFLPS